jgi:hypothetical protein
MYVCVCVCVRLCVCVYFDTFSYLSASSISVWVLSGGGGTTIELAPLKLHDIAPLNLHDWGAGGGGHAES